MSNTKFSVLILVIIIVGIMIAWVPISDRVQQNRDESIECMLYRATAQNYLIATKQEDKDRLLAEAVKHKKAGKCSDAFN